MFSMHMRIIFIALLCPLLFQACSLNGSGRAIASDSDKDSIMDDSSIADTLPADFSVAVGQNVFSISMLSNVSAEHRGNIVCSPLGVEVLYNILKVGAKGETYKELDSALGINETEACLLAKDMSIGFHSEGTTVLMANLIAVNKGRCLLDAYSNKVSKSYGVELWSKDFSLPSTTNEINRWIESNTRGLIRDGIDALQPDAVMCGINTLYFNGKWHKAFDASLTRPTVFTNHDGKKVKVDMMEHDGSFGYLATDEFQAVALPYGQRTGKDAKMKQFSLYVFLPRKNHGFKSVVNYLRQHDVEALRRDMENYSMRNFSTCKPSVNVRLPKFETCSEIDVVSLLRRFGVKHIFSPKADLQDISAENVYVSGSRQKVVVKVDESGTEAAAMTEATLKAGAYIPAEQTGHAYFHADHPFIYAIVSEDTNAILFAGQYAEGMIQRNGVWVADSNIQGASTLSFKPDKRKRSTLDQHTASNTESSSGVYSVCEQMPKFPGGFKALGNFIDSNIHYPVDALAKNIQGRVVVKLIVEKDGSISSPMVVRSVSPSLDKEALRVVKSMPKWNPGQQNGKKVRVEYFVPVSFKLLLQRK